MRTAAFFIAVAFLAVSCKTYTVDPESFRQQLAGAHMQDATITTPMAYAPNITYSANDVKGITVVDKKGNLFYLENSPSIEMRVTQKNGKRNISYFDTVHLRNDTLYAVGSRFLSFVTRKIPFDSIVKIELQDGGKKFNYQ